METAPIPEQRRTAPTAPPMVGAPSSTGALMACVFGATLGLVILSRGDAAIAAAGLAGLVVAGFTLRNPLVGLAALIVITIGNVSDNLISYLGLPSITKLIAPGLAALIAYRWMFYRERPFFHLGGIAVVGGFILIKLLSVIVAENWSLAISGITDFSKELVVAFLALAFLGRKRGFDVLTWSAMAAAAALCALGAVKYTIGNFENPYYGFSQIVYSSLRFAGSISDPNFFAAILVFVIPLAVHISLNSDTLPRKLLGLALLGLLFFGLLMTKSRGGLLAAGVALAVLAPFLERRQLFRLMGAAALVAALGATLLSEELLTRFSSILATAQAGEAMDPAVEGRLASWAVARHLFYENPLIGVGSGNFSAYYQDTALQIGLIFRGEGRSAHSLYLEILAETGLAGFASFLLVVGCALFGVLRANALAREANQPVLAVQYAAFGAGLAGYLVAMTFLHNAFPGFLWLVLITAVALPKIARNALEANSAPEPASPRRPATPRSPVSATASAPRAGAPMREGSRSPQGGAR